MSEVVHTLVNDFFAENHYAFILLDQSERGEMMFPLIQN